MIKNNTQKSKLVLAISVLIGLAMLFHLDLIAQVPRLVVQDDILEGGVFSHDGKFYAVKSFFGSSVLVYDVATGREINSFSIPSGEGNDSNESYAFSPNKNQLAIFNSSFLWIWDYQTGKVVRKNNKIFEFESESIQSNIYYSPDGKIIYIVYYNRLLTYNLITGKAIESQKTYTEFDDKESELKFLGKLALAPYSKLEFVRLSTEKETEEISDKCSDTSNSVYAFRETVSGKIITTINHSNLTQVASYRYLKNKGLLLKFC